MKKKFKADVKNLDDVLLFVHNEIEKHLDKNLLIKLDIVIEEIFVNIAKYAYDNPKDENIDVEVKFKDNKISISFEDNGIKFNPLEKEDPDISLTAEDRQIGGLGIFIVKKTMDKVEYEYRDNKNILTIEKNI